MISTPSWTYRCVLSVANIRQITLDDSLEWFGQRHATDGGAGRPTDRGVCEAPRDWSQDGAAADVLFAADAARGLAQPERGDRPDARHGDVLCSVLEHHR